MTLNIVNPVSGLTVVPSEFVPVQYRIYVRHSKITASVFYMRVPADRIAGILCVQTPYIGQLSFIQYFRKGGETLEEIIVVPVSREEANLFTTINVVADL